jgi:hypothetical protein
MMSAINPALEQQAYENYGCVARGFFDPVSKNLGDPVDHVDRAFNKWKNCRRCAKTHFEESELSLKEYRFNVEDQTCRKYQIIKFQEFNFISNWFSELRIIIILCF